MSVSAAPVLGGLNPLTVTEGDSPHAAASGLSVTGGASYGGGSVTFNLSDSRGSDQLRLVSAADGNASGAVSFDANGFVYLGNGTGRDIIGTVDGSQNGQNGHPLTVNFTGPIPNPSFENALAGWTIENQRVLLGSTVINGHVTPGDVTDPPNTSGDADGASMSFDHEVSTSEYTNGLNSLRLFNNGGTDNGYDVVHGPYAYSGTFESMAGDVLRFDWKAEGGTDAYDAFGYLMNADTGESVVVLNQTGADPSGVTPWTTATVTVPKDGNWFFVFVAGTWDATGGQAVGGSLFIDNFKIVNALVTDSVVQAVANQVTYESATDAALPSRTLTVSVTDGGGTMQTANAALVVTNIEDAPTGGLAVAGTAKQGEVLTAPGDIVDPDGFDPSAVARQWQRQGTDGDWINIAGATGTTYTLTEPDVTHAIRVVSSFTDAGGIAEQITSNPTASVENVNDAPTGGIGLSGTLKLGSVLTLSGDIGDLDDLGPITYHWERQNADGSWADTGATGTRYTLASADIGHGMRAVATYTDGHGTAEQVVSTNAAVTFAPGSYWGLAGAGDFAGDGKADILWHGQGGDVAVWQMNGSHATSGGVVGFSPGSYWSLAGTGDFDANGTSDILWRGQGGEVSVWQMNGTQISGGGPVDFNPGDYWSVAGTGDFNGNGTSDILWRGHGGEVSIWQMNGNQISGGGSVD
ncbi:VCBS repeat-containing protein, partial [Belnapia sp. T6]